MSLSCPSPFVSPRIAGSIIGIELPQPSRELWHHVHFFATLLAAGTAHRVGVLSAHPQPQCQELFQPLEGLLAACHGAASRLLGVPPVPRVVDQRPGVDWFASTQLGVCSPSDIERVIEEATIGRGIVLLINPDPSYPVDLTLLIDAQVTIRKYEHIFPIPTTRADWVAISKTVVNTLIAHRVMMIDPSR